MAPCPAIQTYVEAGFDSSEYKDRAAAASRPEDYEQAIKDRVKGPMSEATTAKRAEGVLLGGILPETTTKSWHSEYDSCFTESSSAFNSSAKALKRPSVLVLG